MNKTFRIIVCVFIIVIVVYFAVGITYGYTKLSHQGKKPCHQEGTTWVSEDKTIEFTVYDETDARGKICLNDEEILFFICDEDYNNMMLCKYDAAADDIINVDEVYEYWVCDFVSYKKFIATVEEATFFKKGQEITFYRVDEK